MKLEDLEKARKAQQQSDRHVYFDDIANKTMAWPKEIVTNTFEQYP